MHVGDGIRFDFADEFVEGSVLDDDLILTSGMEAVNFHAIDAGFPFAMTRAPLHTTLRVLDANHADVTDDFLEESQGLVSLRQPVIPAMFTTDHAVVRQDCLCYFMIEMSV